MMVWRSGLRWLGLPVTLLAAVGNGLAITVFYVAVAPLVPALHSVWFVIHIVAAGDLRCRVQPRCSDVDPLPGQEAGRGPRDGRGATWAGCPTSRRIDELAYRFLAFAFPLWTFTVAAGAIWAEYAWGRYWGWDPKETWALVTWVIYACYLHARSTAGWRGTPGRGDRDHRGGVVLVQLHRDQPAGQRAALLRRNLSDSAWGERQARVPPGRVAADHVGRALDAQILQSWPRPGSRCSPPDTAR